MSVSLNELGLSDLQMRARFCRACMSVSHEKWMAREYRKG